MQTSSAVNMLDNSQAISIYQRMHVSMKQISNIEMCLNLVGVFSAASAEENNFPNEMIDEGHCYKHCKDVKSKISETINSREPIQLWNYVMYFVRVNGNCDFRALRICAVDHDVLGSRD